MSACSKQGSASHHNLSKRLVRRLEEATFTSGLESSEVDIVDVADTPSIPEAPGPFLYLLGSVFGGMLAGSSIAWIAEALDGRVEDGLEASRLLGVPLLAVLPHVKRVYHKTQPHALMLPEVISAPRSSYSEALQSIPASVLSAGGEGTPKVIMVTSSQTGEGKSFTARNLAVILAQHGSSTLLVDSDLRRGRVAWQLGVSNTKGLSNILSGELSLDQTIHPIPGCNSLFVLPSGPYPRLPAVQVASPRMADVIEECRKHFDFLILDVPPLLGVSDALSVGRLADAMILITRNNLTTKKLLVQLRTRASVMRLDILGCVHNDIDPRLGGYGYHELPSFQSSPARAQA